MEKEDKIFAKGLCFSKLFIFFVFGCVFGTYYEELIYFFKYKQWSSRQGLMIGPFNPIYGIPAVILLIVLARKNKERGIFKTYIYSALISGAAEYAISVICEYVFKVKFWNYTGYFLNIGGRTTIPFMAFWGVLGVILLKVLYPNISKVAEKVPYKVAQPVCNILVFFIALDMVFTYSVLGRMALRNTGVKAYTFIGKFYDTIFSNEYIKEKFPAIKESTDI